MKNLLCGLSCCFVLIISAQAYNAFASSRQNENKILPETKDADVLRMVKGRVWNFLGVSGQDFIFEKKGYVQVYFRNNGTITCLIQNERGAYVENGDAAHVSFTTQDIKEHTSAMVIKKWRVGNGIVHITDVAGYEKWYMDIDVAKKRAFFKINGDYFGYKKDQVLAEAVLDDDPKTKPRRIK